MSKELFIFSTILVFAFTTGITWLILKFAYDTYKLKEIRNRKLVYYNEFKVSYIAGINELTSRSWTYKSNTLEESLNIEQQINNYNTEIYKTYKEITDKDLLSIANFLLIPKEKFVSIETDKYTRYE